jgi:hypothetical protein
MVKIMVGRSYEVFQQESFMEHLYATVINQSGNREKHQYGQQYDVMHRHE